MTADIRVGVIGVGWGSLVLAPAFAAAAGYQVVSLCSRRPERLQPAAERLGITDTTTDWRALVRRTDIDLIAVATPTALHHEQTIAALRAGKHVLCEKPAALDETQARQMYEVARETGLVTGVNFEGRWLAERLPVWDLVRDGFLGAPYLARATATAEYWHPSRPLQSEWMYDVAAGGGYLAGMASHEIDFLSALLGDPVAVCADVRTSVPARFRPDGSELPVTADDTSTLLLRMASGARAVIATSTVARHADAKTLELYGSGGSIHVDGPVQGDAGNTTIRAGRTDDGGLTPVAFSDRQPHGAGSIPQRRSGAAIRALALMLEDWRPAFAGQATLVPSLRQGWLVARVVDAARRSSAGAGWVELPPLDEV